MILSDRLSETARYLTAAPVAAWKSFGTQKISSNLAPHKAIVHIPWDAEDFRETHIFCRSLLNKRNFLLPNSPAVAKTFSCSGKGPSAIKKICTSILVGFDHVKMQKSMKHQLFIVPCRT
ncbi:hypothetical protein TNCV_1738121 [Trichonephila clavipes]|nr:hypothetical protein TNCV_1738121 [Trichonephila clavipes]